MATYDSHERQNLIHSSACMKLKRGGGGQGTVIG